MSERKWVNYDSVEPPEWYKCSECDAMGRKMWREHGVSSKPKLLCANCASIDQNKDISDIDSNGKRSSEFGRIDQIGWYLPAVPYDYMDGYWPNGNVPDEGVKWWRSLIT